MIDDMFEEPAQCPPSCREQLELFEKWIGPRSKDFWEHYSRWSLENCPRDGETFLWLLHHLEQ